MIFHQIVTSITPFLKHKCPAHSICDVSFGLPWKILKRFEVGRPFYGVNYSQLDLTWHHFLRSWTDFIPFWKMSFCNCFLETQLSCFRSWRVPGLFFKSHAVITLLSMLWYDIPLSYQTQNLTADSAGWKRSGWCILTSLLNAYSERPFWFMWMCRSNRENVVCLHFKPHLMMTKS